MGKIFFDFIKCKIIYYYFSQTSSHSIDEHSNFVIDGDFFNIFPYKKNEYVLGTPRYSKFKKFINLNSAKNFIKKIKKSEVNTRKLLSEKIVKESFTNFNKFFKYAGHYFSLTTIFNSKSDNRPTLIKKQNNVFFVLGGKIDTMFEAEKEILKKLN